MTEAVTAGAQYAMWESNTKGWRVVTGIKHSFPGGILTVSWLVMGFPQNTSTFAPGNDRSDLSTVKRFLPMTT